MSGLLLELRRQIAHNRRKAAYEERMRASAQEKPQEVFSQKTKETKPDTEIQPEVQERKVNVVSREDFLLSQIDEFRERAKQLQSLLDSRETEAQELQTLVDERQEKADALGQILEERQKKADGFTAEVEKQIDRLIGKVSAKMEESAETEKILQEMPMRSLSVKPVMTWKISTKSWKNFSATHWKKTILISPMWKPSPPNRPRIKSLT
jgi:chromosome segregation ATPase